MKNIKYYGIAMLLIAYSTSLKADVHSMLKEGVAAIQSSDQLLEAAQRGNARQAQQAIREGALLESAHDGTVDAFDIALEKSFELKPDEYGSPMVTKLNNRYAQIAKIIAPEVGNIDDRLAKFKDLLYKDDNVTDQAINFFKSLKMIRGANSKTVH